MAAKVTPLDFSACMNDNAPEGQPAGVSKGNTGAANSELKFTLADPAAGNNAWVGANGGQIEVKLKATSPSTVYTLMNTFYGQDAIPNATVTFSGTNKTKISFQLVGNTDIRDYNNWTWTNTINGTTTQEWWTNNPNPQQNDQSHRLDVQAFDLSEAFAGQTLTKITIQAPANAGPNYMEPALFAIGVAGKTKGKTKCKMD